MSYGTNKCAACGKRTTVPGHRYNGMIRYLCQRDVCKALRTGAECGTCGVKIWTSISYCNICSAAGGRKVSTEGKSACGQTPDSGSIPDCSTDDNELLVAYEDMADRLESAEARINRLENVVLTLEQQVIDLKQNPPYMYSIPDPTPYNYNSGGYVPAPDSGTWSYDKNGGITYSPGVR